MPSELRRYLAYTRKLKDDYGSVTNFILKQRLHWTDPVIAMGKPFEFDQDFKILWNDWPYGIDDKIVHLVIWTKFDLEESLGTGDLTDRARAEIDAFVETTFLLNIPKDRVR